MSEVASSSNNKKSPELKENFRIEYQKVEEQISREKEPAYSALNFMKERIQMLLDSKLPLNELHGIHLAVTALPTITVKVLRNRYFDDELYLNAHGFIKRVLDVIVFLLPKHFVSLAETLVHIFNADQFFYYPRQTASWSKIRLDEPYAQTPVSAGASEFFEDIINYFGKQRGFETIFRTLKGDSDISPCPHSMISILLEAIVSLVQSGYLLESRSKQITKQLEEILIPRLRNLSESELRTSRKEDLDNIFKHLANLMCRIKNAQEVGALLEPLKLKVSLLCLTSSVLDKRWWAIQTIAEMIEILEQVEQVEYHNFLIDQQHKANSEAVGISAMQIYLFDYRALPQNAPKWLTARHMTQWLVENNLVEQIFGNTAHRQIIKRSGPVLRFLASHDALPEKTLDIVWHCATTAHESVASEVFAVLSDTCNQLGQPAIAYILGRLNKMPTTSYTPEILAFVNEMCRKCQMPQLQLDFLNFLWKLMLNESSPLDTRKNVVSLLSNIVELDTFKSHRLDWIKMLLIDGVRQRRFVSFCIKLIIRILITFAMNSNNSNVALIGGLPASSPLSKETLVDVVKLLQERYQIIDCLVEEVEHFQNAARETYNKLSNTEREESVVNALTFVGQQPFHVEVSVRLECLHYLLSNFHSPLNKEWVMRLWKEFFERAVTRGQRSEFMRWLSHAREPSPYSAKVGKEYYELQAPGPCFDAQQAADIFSNKMLQESVQSFVASDLNAFVAFQRLFLDTNVYFNKVTWIPKFQSNDVSQPQFEVVDLNLVGYDAIWNIVLNATHTEVVEKSIEFLNKLHENFSQEMKKRVGTLKLREEFIVACFSQLEKAQKELKLKNAKNEEPLRQVERCLSLLTRFLYKIEGDSVSGPLGTLTRGKPLTLRIRNTVTKRDLTPHNNVVPPTEDSEFDKVLAPAVFELGVHNTLTLGTVRAMINQQLSQLIENPLLIVNKEIVASASDNCTLKELRWENDQEIVIVVPKSIKGRETVNQSRHRSDSNTVTERPPASAKECINQVMEIYNLSENVAQLALKKCSWNVERVVTLLSDEAQLNELRMQALKESRIQSKEITPMKSLFSIDNANDATLPSRILANNPKYFECLLGFLNVSNENIRSRTWELLLRIPIARPIKENLMNIEGQQHPNWETLFALDAFCLLYTLKIVDSLLFPIDESENFELRLRWCHSFVTTGGFARILQILLSDEFLPLVNIAGLETATSLVDSVPFLSTLPQRRGCLALLLKIVDFFMHIVYSSEERTSSSSTFLAWSSITAGKFGADFKVMLQKTKCSLLPDNQMLQLQKRLEDIMWWLVCHSSIEQAQPSSEELTAISCYTLRILQILVTNVIPKEMASSSAANTPLPVCVAAFVEWMSSGRFWSTFREVLLHCPHRDVRVEVATRLYALASSFPDDLISDPKLKLHTHLLENLLNTVPTIPVSSDSDNVSIIQYTGQFYLLLDRLIRDSCGGKHGGHAIKFQSLLTLLVKNIKVRPPIEMRATSEPDEMLIGMMKVVKTLVDYYPPFADQIGPSVHSESQHDGMERGLVIEVYYNGLFALLSEGITEGVQLPKCKTKLSQIAAYDLLISLCKNSAKCYQELLNRLFAIHCNEVNFRRISSWEYHPAAEDKSCTGYVGLKNMGATCYMNALLQQFYMMPKLRADLLSIDDPNPEPNLEGNLLYQLQSMFAYLQESEKMSYDPTSFCRSFKDLNGRVINMSEQHDVEEFFNILCQRLEAKFKGTPHEKLFSEHFGGTLSNEIFSTNSQYPYYSEREEDFYTIPLEVKNRSNIEEALDLYVKSDKLDGDNAYFCEQYNRKIDVLKRCCIKRLSNTLIFHLKRFDFDYATGRKQKLNSYFHFPIFLNMKRWTKEGLGKNELSTKGKAADSTVEENPDDYYQYELVGVLVHTGNAEDGHYYSFIKERQKKFENFSMGGSLTASRNLKQWFCFNDRIVKPFNPELIPEECFGGTQIYTEWDQFTGRRVTKEKPKEKSAYMLFYERIRPLPPHSLEISSKPQQSQQQSQPQQSQPQSQKQPQPQESQQQQVQFPIQMLPSIPTEERVQLLQQSSQQQQSASSQPRINGIPAKIYQNIWKENAQFLRDRQFFDPAYFDFMRDLLNACKFQPVLQYPTLANPIDSINDDGNELRQIKMSTRFFVEILARAKDNEAHVGRWVDDMKKVYSMHIPACVWFLTYVLQNNVLYPLILECPSERLRIAFADLLIHIFKTLSPYEYTMWHDYQLIQVETDSATKSVKQRLSLVLRTMDALLAMIEQSRPCWRRFKQYWMIIHDFASIGWRQRYYLFEKELICVYEDYFMGRQRLGMSRAPVMDEESLPDLREFVDTITILLRGCWTEGTFVKTADAKSSLPSTQKIENSSSATSDSSIVSDSSSCPIPAVPPPHTVGLPPNWRMSPYLQTPVNPFTTPWTLREPDIVLLSMSEMSRKVMFEGEFLIRFLEMDYNTPSAAILLAHICWESLDRSKFVTETLLQCYSTCSQHKLRIFHQLTEPLLKMTDSLMRRRIHWFLSPFSPSFSLAQSFQFSNVVSTKGLLGIIVDAHEHKDRKALSIIYFVLKVASEHRPVLEYLLKRKSRLQWIKEYLECKLVDQRDVLQNDKTKESLQVCRDSDRTEVDINEIEKNPAPYAYELLAKLFDMKDISLEPDGADEELNETLMKLAKAQKDIELLRDQNAKLLQENNALRQKLKQIQSNESEIDTTCPQDTAETQKQNRPMSYTAIHESLDKQLESAPPLGRSRLGPQRGTGQSSNIPFLGYASYNNNTSVYDDDEEENSVQLGKPLEIFRKDDTNTPKQLTKSDVDGRSQEQTPKSTTSTSSEGVSSQLSTKMTTTVPSLNNLSQTTTNAASVTLPSTSTDLPLPQPTNEFESNPNLKKLKEIFTGIEDSVLSYALKISGNDVEIAASELMENDKVNRFRISVQNERQSKRNETKVQSYDDNVESEKGNLRRENDMSKTIILLPRQEHSPNVENRDAKFHDDEIDTLFNSKSQDDKIH